MNMGKVKVKLGPRDPIIFYFRNHIRSNKAPTSVNASTKHFLQLRALLGESKSSAQLLVNTRATNERSGSIRGRELCKPRSDEKLVREGQVYIYHPVAN